MRRTIDYGLLEHYKSLDMQSTRMMHGLMQAVEAYFKPFVSSCQLIPGTDDMLARLTDRYRLGLVSNFTHPPAVDQILARVGLERFFDKIIISGQLGIRKPHPAIFGELVRLFASAPDEIVFVGDELQADIVGAQKAGMHAVWMTYRQRLERPSPLGQFLGMSEEAEGVHPDHVVANWTEFLRNPGTECPSGIGEGPVGNTRGKCCGSRGEARGGTRIRTGESRFCRPLPYHLAMPPIVGCLLPGKRSIIITRRRI